MTFANPKILWLILAVVPLLSLFLWHSWKRRLFLIRQFVQSRLLAQLTVGISKPVQKTRLVLLVIAVALCFFSLARPQWGFAWEEARQQGIDIVVAIDTSRSMLAADLPPDRLTRAKLAALDLMRLARSDRLGLVAFAGTAFLQCPLTLDDEAFRQSVNILDVGVIPQGGTAVAEAIQTALSAFKDDEDNHKVLVLFTDGEDHEEGTVETARKAAQSGLRIFTVGVGTPNGDILRERNESGELVYVKDNHGNVVKSRLNESLLTEIATVANGFYVPMGSSQTIDVLYERGLAALPKTEISSRLVRRFREQYHWFLAAAIALLILEIFLSDSKRAARHTPPVSGSNEALKKAALAASIMLCASVVYASSALRNYESGKYEEAEQQFQKMLERRPDDPRLHYNTGAAAYQSGHYERAIRHFDAAARSTDLDLQQHAYYNLGNSFYRLGETQPDPTQKAPAWEAALKQYQAALKLRPMDSDAQFNYEFLKRKLEELKKQESQQQQSDQDQNKENDKQDQDQQDQQDQSNQNQTPDPSKQNKSDSNTDPRKQKDQNQPRPKEQPDQQQKQDGSDSKEDQQKPRSEKEKPGQQSGDKTNPSADSAKSSPPLTPDGQMTLEQAKRLLDAQEGEEKSMLFVPHQSQRKSRVVKDW